LKAVGKVLEVTAKLMFPGGGLRHGHVLSFRDDLKPSDCQDGQ